MGWGLGFGIGPCVADEVVDGGSELALFGEFGVSCYSDLATVLGSLLLVLFVFDSGVLEKEGIVLFEDDLLDDLPGDV